MDRLNAIRESGKTVDSLEWATLAATLFFTFGPDDGGGGGGGSLTFGSHHSQTKWMNQMTNRGWTMEQIYEAVGTEGLPVKNFVHPGNPATLYYHPETGRAVVVDNATNEILHIGGNNYNYSDWFLK